MQFLLQREQTSAQDRGERSLPLPVPSIDALHRHRQAGVGPMMLLFITSAGVRLGHVSAFVLTQSVDADA
jgi:hypothetical protein